MLKCILYLYVLDIDTYLCFELLLSLEFHSLVDFIPCKLSVSIL